MEHSQAVLMLIFTSVVHFYIQPVSLCTVCAQGKQNVLALELSL